MFARALPKTVDVSKLPDMWVCNMNMWDNERNNCDADEEVYYDASDEELKSFFKVWVKRLKNSDRAESRLPPSAVTRGRKRKADFDWIKCCNPSCGKWRAVSVRGMDYSAMFSKLNSKGGWKSKDTYWTCAMNTWDETTASCAALQESLDDAAWNLDEFPVSIPHVK